MKTILFQGDSVTDAFRQRENTAFMKHFHGCGYPTMVAGKLGYECPGEYNFINRGISGNRIVDVYARLKCDITNLNPDYMSLLIGVNDIWHKFSHANGVESERFDRIYRMLIDDVKSVLPDLKLMLIEPFVLPGSAVSDSTEFPNKYNEFSAGVRQNGAIVKKIAEDYGIVFVPLQAKFDEACHRANPEYWLIDGVHPTAAGYGLITEAWLEGFEKIK